MKNQGLDYFSRTHPLRKHASAVSYYVRCKVFSTFMSVMQPNHDDLILDVGVTPDQELPESNFFEKFYPHKRRIVASSFEDASFLARKYPGLSFVRTERKGLPFKVKAFDIVFCSAVLEHAGNQKDQRYLINELLRVGKSFFIITPNRWFPIEFHTFLPLIHWLPDKKHQYLLKLMGMHFWACTDNLNLLSASTLLGLFPDGVVPQIKRQRLIGLTSNLICYGNA